jgi:CNP1-like family protein
MRWAAVLLLLGLGSCARDQPQQGYFDQQFDNDEKPWSEIESQLPPYPKPENLLPFDVSSAIASSYFVDATSISVGNDGVVRYSLVVKSPQAAETVSYEGMRCETREQKLYAFGRRDNTWARNRNAKWEYIEGNKRQTEHRLVLYRQFFCADNIIVRNEAEAVRALKDGAHYTIELRYRGGGGGK